MMETRCAWLPRGPSLYGTFYSVPEGEGPRVSVSLQPPPAQPPGKWVAPSFPVPASYCPLRDSAPFQLSQHSKDETPGSAWCVAGPYWLPPKPAVTPSPGSWWLSFSLLTRNAPKPAELPIHLHPCLHLICKLEECLLLDTDGEGPWDTRVVEDAWLWSMRSRFSQVTTVTWLLSQDSVFPFGPFGPTVPSWLPGGQLRRPLEYVFTQSCLPVCKFPRTSFTTAFYGAACSTSQSQHSLSVQSVLFHISTSQHLAWWGAPTSPQDSPAAATASRDPLPALGSELSSFDLLLIHFETQSRQQWSAFFLHGLWLLPTSSWLCPQPGQLHPSFARV